MKNFKLHQIILILTVCHTAILAAPISNLNSELETINDLELNPIMSEDTDIEGLEREKRSIHDSKFGAKNAILGFVFGKIDNFIDAKTHFIDKLDQINIIKNKEHAIETPIPINSFKDVIAVIITPKINAITSKLTGLSSGGFGIFGGGSGGHTVEVTAGGGGGASGEVEIGHSGGGGGGSSAGIGSLLSSFLKLSGPILSSSSQSAHAGIGGIQVSASTGVDSSDE